MARLLARTQGSESGEDPSWRTAFAERFELSAEAVERFDRYLSLLLKWNARMNLTAIREPGAIVRRHFGECIFAARQIPSNVKTLLDFGSGAGLPGIPVAICRPELRVTLAESQSRKAAFLREAVRVLDLNAEVWAGRTEAIPEEVVFDGVTLRAVDNMAAACRAAAERVTPAGWFGVFTSRDAESDLNDLKGICWERSVPIPGAEKLLLRVGTRMVQRAD